jgi:OTU domain-containing protein 3
MRGDGNYFFRAVSHQILGHPNNHMKIRSKAVTYLLSNRNDFEGFLVRNENPTMEHYLQHMSVNGNYADSLAIIAAAITINKNIIIHEKEKTPICIPGSDFIDDQIHLWFKNDPYALHYDRVKCINGDPAFLSSDPLVFR